MASVGDDEDGSCIGCGMSAEDDRIDGVKDVDGIPLCAACLKARSQTLLELQPVWKELLETGCHEQFALRAFHLAYDDAGYCQDEGYAARVREALVSRGLLTRR